MTGVTTRVGDHPTRGRSRTERLVDAATTRIFRLPPERGSYSVTPASRVRIRDGVDLLTDHFAPDGPALGTVVMRGPYQRAGAVPHILVGLFASRGYPVVLQSCRGPFGSEGRYVPGEDEIHDGADTVAWLREQPWFEGRFVGVGGSYLSYTLWSMLMEPPPEMVAAVSFVSFHDFFAVVHGTGAFTLNDSLDWCDTLAIQEDATMLRQLVDGRRIRRRRTAAYLGLPVSEGEERFLGAGSAWFRDWATRTDRDDPYWQVRDLSDALDRVSVPVRFLTGWQDLFLGQTIGQYRRLRDRGVEVSLTVGPWTHANLLTKGGSRVFGETLQWVDRHLGGPSETAASEPVSYLLTGADEWRPAADWPPPAVHHTLFLAPGGVLADRVPGRLGGRRRLHLRPEQSDADDRRPVARRGLRVPRGLRPRAAGRRPGVRRRRVERTARRGRGASGDPGPPQRQRRRRPLGPGQRGASRLPVAQRHRDLPRRAGSRRGRADRARARPGRPPVRGRLADRPAHRWRLVPALRAQPRYAGKPDRGHVDATHSPSRGSRRWRVGALVAASDLNGRPRVSRRDGSPLAERRARRRTTRAARPRRTSRGRARRTSWCPPTP